MSFAVEDFRDLLQLLRERPEWKAELRREILGDELLQLPDLVRENTRAIAELRESVGELRESVGELRESLVELRTTVSDFVEATGKRFTGLDNEVASLKGIVLEVWYANRPGLVVRGLRRPRRVDAVELDDLVDASDISETEADILRRCDLVVSGRIGKGDEASDIRVAVEISNVIDRNDVQRAINRSIILGKLGTQARAAVAGHSITPGAEEMARERGVAVAIRSRDGD